MKKIIVEGTYIARGRDAKEKTVKSYNVLVSVALDPKDPNIAGQVKPKVEKELRAKHKDFVLLRTVEIASIDGKDFAKPAPAEADDSDELPPFEDELEE